MYITGLNYNTHLKSIYYNKGVWHILMLFLSNETRWMAPIALRVKLMYETANYKLWVYYELNSYQRQRNSYYASYQITKFEKHIFFEEKSSGEKNNYQNTRSIYNFIPISKLFGTQLTKIAKQTRNANQELLNYWYSILMAQIPSYTVPKIKKIANRRPGCMQLTLLR